MIEPITLSPLHFGLVLLLAGVLVGKAYLMGYMSGKLDANRPSGARVSETSESDPRE